MTALTSSLIVRLIDQVTGPARGVEDSLRRINRAGMTGAAPSFADNMAAAQARVGDAIARNNLALDGARGRLFDAVAGYYALTRAIGGPVRAAMQFESAMADVLKVVDFPTPDAFRQFERDLFALSRRIPLTVQELSEIAAAAGEAGFAADELLGVTEDAARIAVAFGTGAREASAMLAAMRQSYGMSREQALALADAMNHLSNNMASTAPELMEFWSRTAADAGRAGFAQEQAVALGSAMIASGHGADVAATSFRAMIRALTRGESATTRQEAAYERLGLTATDVARRMQEDAVATTRDVLSRIAQLPAEIQNAVSSDLFGDEARALGSIATNLDFFDRAIGAVADRTEYAGSALREFEVRSQTFENSVTLLRNRISELSITIGSALMPALNSIIEVVGPIVSRIAEMAAAYPKVTSAVVGTAAALVGLKIAAAGLTFVGLLGRGGALSLLAGGLRALTFLGTPVAGFFETLAMRSALATRSLGTAPGLLARIGDAALVLGRSVPGVGLLGSALSAIGTAAAAISLPVWAGIATAVAGFAAAGAMVWRYWGRISAVLSGVGRRIAEELQPALDALRPLIEPFQPLLDGIGVAARAVGEGFSIAAEAVRDFMGWIGSFFEQEVLTDEQAAAFEQSGYDVADRFINALKDAFNGFLLWVVGFPARVLEAMGNFDLSSVITWTPPAWISRLLGEEGAVISAPSAVSDAGDMEQALAAARELARLRRENANDSAWNPFDGLSAADRATMLRLEQELGELTAGMSEAARADVEAFVAALEAGGADAEAEADRLAASLMERIGITVTPVVDTSSIRAASAEVSRLGAALSRFDQGIYSPGGAAERPTGHRALGGPVWRGGSFLVGEREPEIINPSGSGEVTPISAIERAVARLAPTVRDAIGRISQPPPAPPASGNGEVVQAARAPSVTIGDIIVQGATDPAETARRVMDMLSGELDRALRGANADMEVRV